MTTHLEIERSERDGAIVVAAKGEIDLASAPELQRHLDDAIGDGHVVIDLLGITFVDSTGLRALIMADEQAREKGGRLTLVPAPGPVTKLFEITGVDQHLTVTGSVESALAVT